MSNQLKTTKIQGKEYVEVFTRVKHFRTNSYYEGWGESTEILHQDDNKIIMKCTITNPEGRIMATGHAMEKENNGYINKTSHVENCETSALGRALGKLGIGIDGGFASYEEVANAKLNQEKQTPQKDADGYKEYIMDTDNWAKALKYIAKYKDTMSLEEIIKTFEDQKYGTLRTQDKTAVKKAYEGNK